MYVWNNAWELLKPAERHKTMRSESSIILKWNREIYACNPETHNHTPERQRLLRAVRDDAERKHCGLRSPRSGKISLRNECEIQRLSGEEKPGEFVWGGESQTNRRETITRRKLERKEWKKNSGNYLSEYNPIPLQFLTACLMTGSKAESAVWWGVQWINIRHSGPLEEKV